MNKEDKSINYNNETLSKKLWSVFKFSTGIIILIIVAYKLIVNEISISISNIDYTVLLSFLLAFFSIVLSMMFYFKSSDSSNQFYDNTYKFTKDISTILGRIEAGFGEKLQNLDKGYSGLLNKIDNSSNASTPKEIEETKTDKIEVEKSLNNEVKERNEIINKLIEKSHLEKKEKEDITKSLYDKEKTIIKLEKDLRFLQSKFERQTTNTILENIPPRLINFFKRYFVRLNISIENINRNSMQEVINEFIPDENRIKNDKFYNDLLESRIIDSENNLTLRGLTILKVIAKNIQE
jgi:hypothetical protein